MACDVIFSVRIPGLWTIAADGILSKLDFFGVSLQDVVWKGEGEKERVVQSCRDSMAECYPDIMCFCV